jgi:hypothetical protein
MQTVESTETTNPLRVGLPRARMAAPCAMVIFGATGDLTRRKLVPALYNLARAGHLPAEFSVVGFARSAEEDEAFREELRKGVAEFSRTGFRRGSRLRPASLRCERATTTRTATGGSGSGWRRWTGSEGRPATASSTWRRRRT